MLQFLSQLCVREPRSWLFCIAAIAAVREQRAASQALDFWRKEGWLKVTTIKILSRSGEPFTDSAWGMQTGSERKTPVTTVRTFIAGLVSADSLTT